MPIENILPIAGTLVGGALGGPAGAAIGSSAGKMFASGIKEKRAQANLPPPIDPMQMGFLNEINDMRKSFETGSAYANQMNQLRSIQSATQSGIIKAAGGNTGAAISGMARAGLGTQQAYGDIAEAGAKRQDALFGMAGEQIDKIAQRKAELSLLQYGQGMKDSAELGQASADEFGKTVASGKLDDIFAMRKKKGRSITGQDLTEE